MTSMNRKAINYLSAILLVALLVLTFSMHQKSKWVVVPHIGVYGYTLDGIHPSERSREMMIFSNGENRIRIIVLLDPKFKIKNTSIGIGSSRSEVNAQLGEAKEGVLLESFFDAGEGAVYDGLFVRFKDDFVDMIGVCRTKPDPSWHTKPGPQPF